MGEFLYNILDSYYSLLKKTGYLKDNTVYKLLVLCFYNDFVMKDFNGLITKEDYKLIEEVLDSFYGTECLISYPDYLKMGKLCLGDMTEIAARVRRLEKFHEDEPEPGPTPTPTGKVWYVGQITKKSYEFPQLTVEELIEVSRAYSVNTKKATFYINKSCWFIMIPEDEDVLEASYRDGDWITRFTKEEIENGFISGVTHADVTIDDRVYHVYVNRNAGLDGANAEGCFKIQ